PQTITVTGVDDIEIDGHQIYSIVLAAAISNDPNYDGMNPNDISMTNRDDESPTLPDTGQTTSYTGTDGADNDYSINPPSFTDNGDGTITDNNTRRMWQQPDDNVIRIWDAAVSYCQYLSLGVHALGVYGDWRLPNPKELQSIVDYGSNGPSIDTTFFPGISPSYYWTATPRQANSNEAWFVNFTSGFVNYEDKSTPGYVRCIREGSESDIWASDYSDYIVIDDGTVVHQPTGLNWQQEDDNVQRNWEASLDYCETLSLGNYSDWRLPNLKELTTIVDYSVSNPSITTSVFLNIVSDFYWSSTINDSDTSFAWVLDFENGYVNHTYTSNDAYVRCVRGGQ
ncbi:MAG: DUF1566 domain-containing protein, partial [SAR324 cluster bacterium]|nr:DUF1566 domain-containing protein [SAR324 cluster bacterium]